MGLTEAEKDECRSYFQGIGSKIMARMGYVVGQGLGKSGEGRAEPVPIQLLPQGLASVEFVVIVAARN